MKNFLDDLASRVSIAKIIGQKVAWDPRKSNPSRGEYWGLCPFHQEKTPSFKVDDQKGFYICFGCHAKGDAIKFLRETGNIGFMDAVAILARDVGMTIPAPDPEARKAADRRALLEDAVEAALTFFRLQLQSSRGAAARNYLRDRGLEDATLAQFEIGYAPEGGSPLHQFLAGRNIPPDVMIDAGLVIRPDDGGKPYDRFRDRIMFPIRHPRGACIGFGGRAMNPKVPAKYINSPETPLFDKGRTLYNFGPAREAAGKSGDLVVVEGYMDVIALVASGVENAVAPLGTAITAGQLELMWRASAEPVITLDGDEAGRRAALRLMDLALPLLKAGRSLRFVMLPEGTDPDDLIRQGGRDAMRRCLAESRPMVDLLWQRETEGRVFDSPERRAALDKVPAEAVRTIPSPKVRDQYRKSLQVRMAALTDSAVLTETVPAPVTVPLYMLIRERRRSANVDRWRSNTDLGAGSGS